MYNYVQLLLALCLTVVIVLIWSLMDRRRTNYDHLLYWSMIVMRYYLAAIMLSYGLAKVFRTQFPPLSLFNTLINRMASLHQWVCYGRLWDTPACIVYSLG